MNITKKSKWIGGSIIYKESTDSTNLDATRMSDRLPDGAVIVADSQTAGSGRRGRTWVSPAGDNLYFSLLLKPDLEPRNAAMLTLVMALAVARAVKETCGAQAMIKWPNDIVVQGKKICGILTQMQLKGTDMEHVIIGVGINVNQSRFETGLKYASSLQRETGKVQDRAVLLAEVLYQFEVLYEQFLVEQSLEFMHSDYEKCLVNLGREVQILDPKGAYEAVALGINEIGELVVGKSDGSTETVYAGEVSVRGLFGYV